MTREEALDELAVLATVEHALLVEYLTVYSALGQDVEADVTGASARVQRAAGEAETLAKREMAHLHQVNDALLAAGRPVQVGRATGIRVASGAEISLRPPAKAELERLLAREREIALAVDERYRKLGAAVDEELSASLGGLLEFLANHVSDLEPLADALGDAAPSEFLRAFRREPEGDLERELLALSDDVYAALVSMARTWFARDDQLLSPALDAMEALRGVNAELVKRGLLPAYSLAA